MLEHEDVQAILRLLDATPLTSLELETARFKLVLRRAAGGGWTQEQTTRRAGGPAPAVPAAAAPIDPPAAAAPAAAPDADAADICAPLVGTFYRAPQPGAAPFVVPGGVVGADTVVGIVETMKLMTAVVAGRPGRIAEILAVDGQSVEQRQVLMRLVPA